MARVTRGGATTERDEPERRCLVTGETGPKSGLVRFVVGPRRVGRARHRRKTAGPGALCDGLASHIGRRRAKGQFARAAKAPVTVPDDLADEVERQLVHRVVDLVSLARKAGLAVAGFEKVKEALAWPAKAWQAGLAQVRVLLQASDGSERGKAKLWTPEGARYFGCLTSEELGLAFGRETVIHAGAGVWRLGRPCCRGGRETRVGLRDADLAWRATRRRDRPEDYDRPA